MNKIIKRWPVAGLLLVVGKVNAAAITLEFNWIDRLLGGEWNAFTMLLLIIGVIGLVKLRYRTRAKLSDM